MLQQVDDLLFDEYRSWGDGSESAAESASNHANAVLALPVWLIATGFFVISTHVWFAIGTSVASAVVAVNRGVGSRQTLADVRLAFMNYSARVSHSISFEMPRIFMEVDLTRGARRILATSLMQNCFLPLKKKKTPQQRGHADDSLATPRAHDAAVPGPRRAGHLCAALERHHRVHAGGGFALGPPAGDKCARYHVCPRVLARLLVLCNKCCYLCMLIRWGARLSTTRDTGTYVS